MGPWCLPGTPGEREGEQKPTLQGEGELGAGQCGPLMRMQKGQGESQGGLGGAGNPWERTHRTIPATRVGSPLRDPLPLPSCTLGAEQAPVQAR